MYKIIFTRGNDYHCSCCRRTWTDYEEFDTLEGIARFEAENIDDDFCLDEIFVYSPLSLEDDRKYDELLKVETEKVKVRKEIKRKKDELEDKKKKESCEKKMLKKLKDKYE